MARLMDVGLSCRARRAGLEERVRRARPRPAGGGDGGRDLHHALVKLLAAKPVARVNTDHVAPVRASVADTLEELVARLPGEGAPRSGASRPGCGNPSR